MRKKILIIHSLPSHHSWVQDVNEGLHSIFNKQDFIKINYHYMNLNPIFKDEHLANQAGQEAKQLIKAIRPDVIITCDDTVQSYVAVHYANNPSLSIVFCGVNSLPESYDFHRSNNVTGILERPSITGIRDVILLLARKKNLVPPIRVVHICSRSPIAKGDDLYLKNAKDWDGIEFLPTIFVNTFQEWRKAFLNSEGNFILISNYRGIAVSDFDTQMCSASEMMSWMAKHAKVPVIGLDSSVVEDGGPLAIASSPYEQGRVAANMACDIIFKNQKPSEIPIAKTQEFIVCMNPQLVEKMNMWLPEVYTAFSKATKKIIVPTEEKQKPLTSAQSLTESRSFSTSLMGSYDYKIFNKHEFKNLHIY